MGRTIGRILALATVLAFLDAAGVHALINPHFTPVHLVNQSSLILELELHPAKDGTVTAEVRRAIKGKEERKTLEFRLTTSQFSEHIKNVEAMLAGQPSGMAGLLFVGAYDDDDGGPGGQNPAAPVEGGQKAFLHVSGTWIAFAMGKTCWEMVQLDGNMGTTWAGGTDMLSKAAEYILDDPDAVLPVREGVRWSGFSTFATLEGDATAALPVDLVNDGKLTLHIACAGGDRLFRYDAEAQELKDVTPAAHLTAKSRVAAWGDFNADGRMDLASWDSEAIVIHAQGVDGVFQIAETLPKAALTDGCLSLSTVDTGKAGKPGLLIGTRTSPLLWTPGGPAAIPVGGAFAGADLGAPGITLTGDLDSDTLPDILQLFEGGSLVCRGKALGQFEDANRCPVAAGAGATCAFLGDFDADGLLDIFTLSAQGASALWNNRGRFEFVDALAFTGELSYKGGAGSTGGMTGDFNNDGLQDVLFQYDAAAPRLYFNRGFRSFGLANGMDLGTQNLLPPAEDGQQASCLMDLNGDGAQDMVVVLRNGEAWSFYVEAGEGTARCARAVLSSKGGYVGPMNVTGWRGKRCLGAWSVLAGTAEGFFGQEEAGPVLITWQFPGGPSQRKEVIVENAPVRVPLAP